MTQFKENMIFQMFKDKALGSATKFKNMIEKKYSGMNYADIYRKIINYQVGKYGGTLVETKGNMGHFVKDFASRTMRRKINRNLWENLNNGANGTNRIIERNEV